MWNEVGPDCFRRRYESFDLNIGVVRGADGFFVIDTRCGPTEALELLDELRVLGNLPVRRIVNSHSHFDHCFGNATLRAAYPDVEIWGHERFTDESDDARKWLRVVRPEWADEIDRVVVVLPDHLVHDETTIDLGDRGVTLRHPGRGHTDNDLVCTVSDAAVVYAGDIVEQSAPPAYGDDCFPLEWAATNTRLLEWITPDTTVVPGHGDVVDRGFIADQIEDLDRVARTIRELHAAGVPATDALAAAEWPFPAAGLADAVIRGYAQLE